jgi:hypothetical protein
VVACKYSLKGSVVKSVRGRLIGDVQDIAPTYYDISTFGKGEVKTALIRTMEKIRRKEATKGAGRR